MASQSVGSAIASNPSFSVLRSALVKADVIGSLDDAPALTVFAPNNLAFSKVPARRLQDLVADPKAFSLMLRQHVVPGRLSPEQLPGAHKTLAGGELMVTTEAGGITVNGTARVLCANVQTANATIYVIDTVLRPD